MDEPLSISLRLLMVFALVLVNGLFVAAEFSIITVRRSRVEALAAKGNPAARLAMRAIGDVNNYLAATQLGITMASIGLGFVGEPVLAALIEPLFEDIFGESFAGASSHAVSVIIAFSLITGMHIVLGELAPKSVALFRPLRVSLFTVPPTEVFRIVFWPVIWVLNGLANALLRPFGLRAAEGGAHSVHTAEEINLLVAESAEAGALEQGEAELLAGVFSFGDRRVNEVMVPRTEVIWLPRSATVEDFYKAFRETPHSRFPVFGQSQDDVTGIVGIKDVLRGIADDQLGDESPIELAMRPAMFVPETKFVGPLFFEMQRAGHQMAVVIDEYGGTAGIVTLEMLIEELVGYVGDELRRHDEEFVTVDENTFQIDAGMTITDANEELDLDLPEGEYETVGGFVLAHLGYIPTEGDVFKFNDLQVSVTRMTGRKIEEVTVTRQ